MEITTTPDRNNKRKFSFSLVMYVCRPIDTVKNYDWATEISEMVVLCVRDLISNSLEAVAIRWLKRNRFACIVQGVENYIVYPEEI